MWWEEQLVAGNINKKILGMKGVAKRCACFVGMEE
jgi:hypothetical protein